MAKYNLPIATMKVSSPNGEMRTRHLCPVISLEIWGVDFLSNLIILDSQGIDIIFGMDWLNKHDGVLHCAK